MVELDAHAHLDAAQGRSQGKTGLGVYPDGMVEHDGHVGRVLDKLRELGLEQNTIVMYSTDNGAEKFTWPDGGQSPFRGEKNTNWEGGYRVPAAIRWPGVIKPGTIFNDIFAHEDMLPTLLAAAGDANVKPALVEHLFMLVPAQQYVGRFLATFKQFPPSQKPGSFSIDAALEALQRGSSGGR